MRRERNYLAWLAVVILIGMVGCGGNNGRVAVSGTVTVDSRPLENGSISFIPPAGTQAPSAGGGITDGKFAIPAQNGPLPGKYVVRIAGSKLTGKTVKDPQVGPVPERVPLKFTQQELQVEVPAGEPQPFEFNLTEATKGPRGQ